MNDDTLDDEQETMWVFNDINLTSLMVILFFTVLFASLMGTKEMHPNLRKDAVEAINSNTYGDFEVQVNAKKGHPTKNTLPASLLINGAGDGGDSASGVDGDGIWEFDQVLVDKDKKVFLVSVESDGTLYLESEKSSIKALQKRIEELSKQYNVYLEVVFEEDTPLTIYEDIRHQLWDNSPAAHWKFRLKE